MRHPAVLGALAEILTRDLGGQHDPVDPVGDDVALAAEGGHPEGVDDVRRMEMERGRLPDGNVQLIGGGDLELGIRELPPPLLARDVHPKIGSRGRLLGLEDDPDGGDADDEQDDRKGDRPGDLEHGVAVDLLRDGRARPVAEAPARVDERRLDHDEDHQRGPGDQHEDLVDPLAEVRARPDGRHRAVPEAPAARRHEHGDSGEEDGGADVRGTHQALGHVSLGSSSSLVGCRPTDARHDLRLGDGGGHGGPLEIEHGHPASSGQEQHDHDRNGGPQEVRAAGRPGGDARPPVPHHGRPARRPGTPETGSERRPGAGGQ